MSKVEVHQHAGNTIAAYSVSHMERAAWSKIRSRLRGHSRLILAMAPGRVMSRDEHG